jgi:high-affinity nickel-transport protein
MNITLISVAIALFIGGVEGLQVISTETGASGGIWNLVNRLQLADLGFFIIGAFVVSWALSLLIYKLRRYDRLDVAGPVALTEIGAPGTARAV